MPSVSYSVDTVTNFPNPERGFTALIDTGGSEATDPAFFASQLSAYARTFYRITYSLNAFSSTAISAAKLTELDTLMNRLRSSGVKCALRARYDSSGSGTDASIGVVATHITQMQPYLSAHQDVIAIWEAGFIGSWGEWAYSNNFGTIDGATYTAGLTTAQWADRQSVIDNMLSAAPNTMLISMRYPYMKQHFFGDPATSAGEAFSIDGRARIGHFNDYFISNARDGNTYLFTATDRAYLASDSFYVPNGGESGAFDATYGACTPAQTDLSLMHITYLNQFYFPATINDWSVSGCFTTIQRNLGYRLQLVSSTYASTATVGAACNVNIVLNNVGYAAPFSKRTAYYVLKSSTASYAFALATECRRWFPGSSTVVDSVSLLGVSPGSYNAYLWLPDRNAALSNRPAYSIRCANDGVWDSATGLNALNQSITIVTPNSDQPTAATIQLCYFIDD